MIWSEVLIFFSYYLLVQLYVVPMQHQLIDIEITTTDRYHEELTLFSFGLKSFEYRSVIRTAWKAIDLGKHFHPELPSPNLCRSSSILHPGSAFCKFTNEIHMSYTIYINGGPRFPFHKHVSMHNSLQTIQLHLIGRQPASNRRWRQGLSLYRLPWHKHNQPILNHHKFEIMQSYH